MSTKHHPTWLLHVLPFLRWKHRVTANTIKSDLISGLTVAIVVVPQAVAFASIAGMPPQYGLYAGMIPPIIAAFFGSSWHLMSGPTTAASIVLLSSLSVFAEPLTPEYVSLALTLTFMVGVLELGGEKTLPQSLLCVATGGTISIIGVLSGGTMSAQLGRIIMKQARMVGIGVGNRDGFEAMLRAMALHQVAPVVDRVFAFDELKQAMAHLKSGAHFGKVCIRHGGQG